MSGILTAMRTRLGSSIGIFWLLLAISVLPGYGDGYTQIKTVVLWLFLVWSAWRMQPAIILPKALLMTAAALALAYIVSMLINLPGSYGIGCLEWAGMLVAIVFTFQKLQGASSLLLSLIPAIRVSLALVVIYQLGQELGFEPIPGLWHNDFSASLFGFQNMTAEFYGISLSALWIFRQNETSASYRGLDIGLIILGLAGLASTASRTAALATGLMLVVSLCFIPKPGKSAFMLLVTVGLGGSLGILLMKAPNRLPVFTSQEPHANTVQELPGPAPEAVTHRIIESKSQTSRVRYIRLRNSLLMMSDLPWGIGPGNYEFGYLPYRQAFQVDPEANASFIPKSPHNGFLELAIENGWLSLAIVIGIILVFGSRLMQDRAQWRTFSLDHKWGLGLLVFLAVDAALAFPLELPFSAFASILALAISVDYAFKRKPEAVIVWTVKKPWRMAIGLTLGAGFLLAALGSGGGRSDAMTAIRTVSCRVFPEQWQPCIRLAYQKLDRNPQEAYEMAQAMMKGKPHHFPARLLLASSAYLLYKDEELCEALRLYKQDTGELMTVSRLAGRDKMDNLHNADNPADDPCK